MQRHERGRRDLTSTEARRTFRELDAADADALKTFACHQRNQWTKNVQHTVRQDIVDLVTGGLDESTSAVAVGLFEAMQLVGVAAYDGFEHFEVLCLATASSHQGKGIGGELKKALLTLAAEQGHAQVFSLVHRRNDPMLSINRRLGAWMEPDELDGNLMLCVVNV